MKKPKKTSLVKLHLKNVDAKKLLRNRKVIEEINRHKWLESEIAGYDIGFEAAAESWLKKYATVWIAYHENKKSKPVPQKAFCQVISAVLKNIETLPEPIQPIVCEFAHKLTENLGDYLCAVLVYGSAAGTNYNHNISNINLAVIVKNLDFAVLNQSLELVQWGHKRKIATPLFLTKEYVLGSLDVFPIEFTEIKQQHKVILGEDIFKDLEVPVKDVRLLCEQQVKGKLLHLRQAYLEIGRKPDILKNFLLSAYNDLVPVFRQLIVLKGQRPMEQKDQMLAQLAKIFSLDQEPFLAAYHDKSRKALMASNQVQAHVQNFLTQLESLSRHLDSL